MTMNTPNANMGSRRRYNFMGCPLDAYTHSDAIRDIVVRIRSGSTATLIHFLNVAKIVGARTNPRLSEALWDGDIVLADGKPLVPLGTLLGMDIPERINGVDLMLELLNISAREGFGVYLLGAKQDVIEKCVASILEKHPNLRIAGYRNGYFTKDATEDVIHSINSTAPDILFVGMGTPQKEMFAFENRNRLKVSVVQGAGGSFDVIAGVVRRAPMWMQQCGLEWFFRVLQEPRRMFWRYLSTNSIFIVLYCVEVVSFHLRRRKMVETR
jgi:N-acetylglucosaminyldiphosphoundecaprenol N-acetyl-beta-D-mannosaminyltransferase